MAVPRFAFCLRQTHECQHVSLPGNSFSALRVVACVFPRDICVTKRVQLFETKLSQEALIILIVVWPCGLHFCKKLFVKVVHVQKHTQTFLFAVLQGRGRTLREAQ